MGELDSQLRFANPGRSNNDGQFAGKQASSQKLIELGEAGADAICHFWLKKGGIPQNPCRSRMEVGQLQPENSTEFRPARSIRQTCREEVSYVSRALFFAQIPLFRHPAGFTTLVMKTASQSVDSLQ